MSERTAIPDSVCPWRRPHIEAFAVAEELVLYDPAHNQIIALNESAREVWERCDGATKLSDLIAEMSRLFGVNRSSMDEDIRHIVSRLQQQNMLAVRTTRSLLSSTPSHSSPLFVTFGGHQVVVKVQTKTLGRAMRSVFQHMLGSGSAQTVGRLEVYDADERYSIRGTRVHHVQLGTLQETIRSLKHEIVARLIDARPDLLWLHAGAVSRTGTALMFAGMWASGKSTLAAELYRRGWYYLSDDIIPFDPASERVTAFPVGLAYRTEGSLSARARAPVDLPKTRVAVDSSRIPTSPQPVRAVIFPRFVANGLRKLEPRSPSSTAVGLAQCCQNAVDHRGDAFRSICRLAENIPGYDLTYGRGGDAADAVLHLAEALEPG